MANNSSSGELHTIGIDDVVIGSSFSILSLIEMVFYIPCMVVMRTDAELKIHSCFQMMFHLGIADLIHLVAQFFTGICVATGSVYKIPPWLNHLFGGIFVSFSWYIYLPICNIVALNRFVSICLPPQYQNTLFTKKSTIIWLSVCWLYGGLWFTNYVVIPRGNFAYNPAIYTFSIDDEFVKWQSWWQNTINLGMSAFWYIAIIISLRILRRSMTTAQKRMQEKERRIMAQASLICLYTLAFDQYWHWVAQPLYINFGFKYAYGLGNLLWISTSGVNPLIYLTMNKTIKKKVKLLVCKNRVEPMLKRSYPKQRGQL